MIVLIILFVLVVLFEDELRHKHWAVEIRERIAEALCRVHLLQRVEVAGGVFAYAHGSVLVAQTCLRRAGFSLCSFRNSKITGWRVCVATHT